MWVRIGLSLFALMLKLLFQVFQQIQLDCLSHFWSGGQALSEEIAHWGTCWEWVPDQLWGDYIERLPVLVGPGVNSVCCWGCLHRNIINHRECSIFIFYREFQRIKGLLFLWTEPYKQSTLPWTAWLSFPFECCWWNITKCMKKLNLPSIWMTSGF